MTFINGSNAYTWILTTATTATGAAWQPYIPPPPPATDDQTADARAADTGGLGEDMRERIEGPLEKALRQWNDHAENNGRALTGGKRLPYDEDKVTRAINRWNGGEGSFLIQQFFADMRAGHPTTVGTMDPPPSPEERIPADDPRLMRMWATIAKNAAERGTTGHYDVISRETGAPSMKRLEEEEWLWQQTHLVYRIETAFDVRSEPGVRHPTRSVTGGMIRAALLQLLEEKSDEDLLASAQHYDSRAIWTLGTGKAAEQAEEEQVQDGEHGSGDGGAGGDGGERGSGAGADGGADAGADARADADAGLAVAQ